MSMTVKVSVNGQDIISLRIVNETGRATGVNTYHWTYMRHDLGGVNALLSTQEGAVYHVYEDGAMALISKVAQAASDSETP